MNVYVEAGLNNRGEQVYNINNNLYHLVHAVCQGLYFTYVTSFNPHNFMKDMLLFPCLKTRKQTQRNELVLVHGHPTPNMPDLI